MENRFEQSGTPEMKSRITGAESADTPATAPLYPPGAVLMAPLSGYTDLPYRRSMRRHGCRYAFTEMVDAASLYYARERAAHMLVRGEDEDFLGVQLLGGCHEFLKAALDILNEYDFDVLDFNLGCPVPKVTKKCAGAELGRHVEEALACFALFPQRSRHRLSAKIRILSETDPEPTLTLARGLAELGACAITVHGRIKDAIYSGPVYYDIIAEVVKTLPGIPVIGNGSVRSRQTAEPHFAAGCTGVMAARGAMGNPWLFEEFMLGDAFVPPDAAAVCDEAGRHIMEMVALYGETPALRIARKMLHDYFKHRGFGGALRLQASRISTVAELQKLLTEARQVVLPPRE